jgi:hypothetical protein
MLTGLLVALERRLGDQNLDETIEDDFSALQESNIPCASSLEQPSSNEWFSLGVFNDVQEGSTNSSSDGSGVEYFPMHAPLLENPALGAISDLIKQDLYVSR